MAIFIDCDDDEVSEGLKESSTQYRKIVEQVPARRAMIKKIPLSMRDC